MNILRNHPSGLPKIKEKIESEAKQAFILTIYFAIWFCSLTLLMSTAHNEKSVPLSLFGFAFIKAALCAKFMLIALAIFPLKLNKNHGIILSLLKESILYIIVVLLLTYVEAGISGALEGRSFIDSMLEFGQSNPLRVIAMSVVYWLIVWPYLVLTGMRITLGTPSVVSLFFGYKKQVDE